MDSEFENWVEGRLEEIESGIAVNSPTSHQSLFKYISLNGKKSWNYLEQTLGESKIYGTTSNALNDPFELQPAVFNDISAGTSMPIWSLLGIAESNLPPNFKDRDLEYYKERAHAQLDILREESRVISFSERYDSPLLWAHYANSYRGACLHFIGGRLMGRNSWSAIIGKVLYRDQRPLFPLSLPLKIAVARAAGAQKSDRRTAELNTAMFFTKASDWSYEKEYRAIYSTKDMTSFEFNPRSFATIIVGPNMPQEDVDRLLSIASSSSYEYIPIRKASISKSSFAVQVDWDDRLN